MQSEPRFFISCDSLSPYPTGFCQDMGCNKEQKCMNEMSKLGSLDKQEGGDHYQIPIQPIEYIVKNALGYREGNVIKYVTRHDKKNGAEDIKKAIHYLEMILEDYSENIT